MTTSILVAAAEDGVISEKGGHPWHLPAELRYFKQVTMGHPMIMGRKTHESIGKALKGRLNIVLSRNPNYKPAEGAVLARSLGEALVAAQPADEVFIIGGEEVFNEALGFADRIYLTRIKIKVPGDRFFKFEPNGWEQVSSDKHKADDKNQYDYEFTVLERAKTD